MKEQLDSLGQVGPLHQRGGLAPVSSNCGRRKCDQSSDSEWGRMHDKAGLRADHAQRATEVFKWMGD